MKISFEDLALKIAKISASRSEDPYKKVGCSILDKNGRVLAVGYNGLQPKQKVSKLFWDNRDERRKYIIHAESNALSCVRRSENPFLLASTLLPCKSCAINIAAYGIKKVIYIEDYHMDQEAISIFKFYNIRLKKQNDE